MSIADTVTKQYLQDNEVFSDVFNYQLFDGEQVIHPEDLTELDPSEMLVLSGRSTKGKQSKPRTRNLFRDLMKNTVIRRDQHAVYRLNLGTELQTNVHYAMPVRNQMYDAIDYYDQIEQTAKRHRRENNPPASSSGEFLSGFLVKLLADVINVHEEIRFGNLLERQAAVLKVFRDIVLNLMHHRTAFGGNPGGLRQPGEALQDHFLKTLPVLLMFHLDQPFRQFNGG